MSRPGSRYRQQSSPVPSRQDCQLEHRDTNAPGHQDVRQHRGSDTENDCLRGDLRATRQVGRRAALAAFGTSLLGSGAGCLWTSSSTASFPDVDILAGPDGALAFDPAELTVSVGDSVSWGFASGGYNVSCRPTDSDRVALPDGAEPFASYRPAESANGSFVPRGDTFEHTVEMPGRFVYVCIPHVNQGMVGTIRVE